jgi:type IV secretory pathway TrbD component
MGHPERRMLDGVAVLFCRVSFRWALPKNKVMPGPRARRTLLRATEVACGVLGFALLMWTPATGSGLLAYLVLFALLIGMGIALSSGKRGGYWPGKRVDH